MNVEQVAAGSSEKACNLPIIAKVNMKELFALLEKDRLDTSLLAVLMGHSS